MKPEIKPCPFCGHSPRIDNLMDSLHPTTTHWFISSELEHELFETEDGFKFPIQYNEVLPPVFINEHGKFWVFSCLETEGGCGCEMHGFSEEDVMAKWNQRV